MSEHEHGFILGPSSQGGPPAPSGQSKSESIVSTGSGRKVRILTKHVIAHNVNFRHYNLPCVHDSAQPASWTKVDGVAVVACPACGHRNPIREGSPSHGNYKVNAKGLVYPSLLCENMECDFDHYVLLQGWSTMGRFGRAKDNARGVIFYCLAWLKWGTERGVTCWRLQPFEYTHASSEEEARRTWAPLLNAEMGKILGIAPAIDPHVSGDADSSESILNQLY